jgi:hypothetical protein
MRNALITTARPLLIGPVLCSVVVAGVVLSHGCIDFDTPDVRVDVSHTSPPPSDSQSEWTAHGWTLRKVIRQRYDVLEEMNQGEWDDVEDEIVDWQQDISELRGYANSSSDPATFRRYCDELMAAVDRVSVAAEVRDKQGIRSNCDAAGVILNRFDRDFPMTRPRATAP